MNKDQFYTNDTEQLKFYEQVLSIMLNDKRYKLVGPGICMAVDIWFNDKHNEHTYTVNDCKNCYPFDSVCKAIIGSDLLEVFLGELIPDLIKETTLIRHYWFTEDENRNMAMQNAIINLKERM